MCDINFEIKGIEFTRHEGILSFLEWDYYPVDMWQDVVWMLCEHDCPLRPTREWFEAICNQLKYEIPKTGCELVQLQEMKSSIEKLNQELKMQFEKQKFYHNLHKLNVVDMVENSLCPDGGDIGDVVVNRFTPTELVISCPEKGKLTPSDLFDIETVSGYSFEEMSYRYGRTYHFVR